MVIVSQVTQDSFDVGVVGYPAPLCSRCAQLMWTRKRVYNKEHTSKRLGFACLRCRIDVNLTAQPATPIPDGRAY